MKGFPKFNQKSYLLLALIAISLVVLLSDLIVRDAIKKDRIFPLLAGRQAFEGSQQFEYPILKNNFTVKITAQGAIIMDSDSKAVLFAKNPNLRFSSASTAKIMTAITALSYFSLNDLLTVKNSTVEGSVLGLKKGQKMTFENLLYGLLLPSANDTAVAIAQNFNENENAFVKKMNQNARQFNLFNTHFEDPAGLLDDSNYTTPLDLARLASVALENKTFKKVVATKQKTIFDSEGQEYPVKNLNKLLGINGVEGVKTGFTEGAGEVLVTSKLEGNHTIIIVVMGSQDRFGDTEKLLGLLSNNVTYLPIHP